MSSAEKVGELSSQHMCEDLNVSNIGKRFSNSMNLLKVLAKSQPAQIQASNVDSTTTSTTTASPVQASLPPPPPPPPQPDQQSSKVNTTLKLKTKDGKRSKISSN